MNWTNFTIGLSAVVIVIMGFVVLSPANAAEFKVNTFSDSGEAYIVMEGAVEAGDMYRLKRAYEDDRIAPYRFKLILNSPGGNGEEMKKIAAWVEEKEATTAVYEGDICYSACAVIWVHGAVKFMQPGAEIGFHVSSIAMTPKSVEWLDAYHGGYGWAGVQQLVQDNYAEALRYYADFNVADVNAFVANIAMASAGPNFWMVTVDNMNVIGGVRLF